MKTKQSVMILAILFFVFSDTQKAQIKHKIERIGRKEVKTLVNEMKEPGRYTVQFDASTFASGMYVYQIKANDFMATKKMILVK